MSQPVYPLEFKPDIAEAARRWEAYYAGEIIDRPVVVVTAPLTEDATNCMQTYFHGGYREHVFGDMEEILDRALDAARQTYFGGEATPAFIPTFGPDEVAVFCGAELWWSDDSVGTNWSKPFIKDWEKDLPFRLQDEHPLWQRMLAFYRLAAGKLKGRMLLTSLDLHTGMDLLAAARGPQRLCMDLIEQPEMINEAMKSARAIFPQIWNAIVEAGQMDEHGYRAHPSGLYSMEGAAMLACDFSYMIGPEMFNRWALPALEEEAEVVKHAYYEWDGPGALIHMDALCASRGLHTLGYGPGVDEGSHMNFLDLLKEVQKKGKAIEFGGSPEECKAAHRELTPEKVMYVTTTANPKEADDLLRWFVDNT